MHPINAAPFTFTKLKPLRQVIVSITLGIFLSGCVITIPFQPRPMPEPIKQETRTKEWTTEQKTMLVASFLAAGADYVTTRKLLYGYGKRERNPLIGEHPSEVELAVKGWGSYGLMLLFIHFTPELRPIVLMGQTTMNTGFAIHNYKTIREIEKTQ